LYLRNNFSDNKLSWTNHVDKVVAEAKKLDSALGFIRKKLNKEQFMKVLTCQFHITCYYASAAWLHGGNSFRDIRWLNALHYRSLRIAHSDYSRKLSRAKLDECGRMRPTTWAKYQTASTVVKALEEFLMLNSYSERRQPKRLKLFNKASLWIGK